MKITRTLDVSEYEFYDYLESQLLSDLQKHSMEPTEVKKGAAYTKFDEKTQSYVSFEIEDYKRGSSYRMKVKSSFDTCTVHYRTQAVPKGLEVIFYQEIESFQSSKQNKFLRLFSEAVYFGRMSDALFEIQKGITRNRNEKLLADERG
ncbi:uncharacterized protein DUF3284 [Trichococcus patagoniensis]|uniref:Uncharacterized protein DUF3284 n=1 Tax=Trichococcus patagoniensis TaxID=382641 RepID=A0A2T5IM88_9LACT|nr:DUF3284 domain-containing protein [Trichococcus patagoniensis]PTQ84944.1 uncharacterized protein DUF3284 [Trichococcus patagoniensis]